MSKHKNFHGPGGKGGLVRQMRFYCKKNPYDVIAQPLSVKQKKSPASVTSTGGGRGGNIDHVPASYGITSAKEKQV